MTDERGEPAASQAPASAEPADELPTSGLRNPEAAVRGVGMATLGVEWLVLLLALQPIRMVAPDTPGWALGVVAALAFACLGAAALLRYRWGWTVASALQVAIVLTGLLQWALFVVGGVFVLIWLYVLHVRRTVSRPARFDH